MSNMNVSTNNIDTDNKNNITNMKITPQSSHIQNIQQESNNSIRSEAVSENFQVNEQASSLFDTVESKCSTPEFFTQRISPENFSEFCEQLHSFTQHIRNIQVITNLTYHLPSRLQERLEEEAKELDCLYGEVREANNSIDRINLQRKAVRKEKLATEKQLKKLKEEETREMETVISVYDRIMFSRWELIKNSKKLEAVENFLSDIEGKLLAMKHLKTLATQKLNKVITWTLKQSTDKKNRKDSKRPKSSDKKYSSTASTSSCVTEQEINKKKLSSRVLKTDLSRTETVNNNFVGARQSIYSTLIHIPDDIDLNEMSYDSMRAVELNSEMQNVLRTLFGGPVRREASLLSTQVQTSSTTTNSTTTNASLSDSREINIFLSHSYQN